MANTAPVLTIHLYGPDQSNGDPTKTPGMGARVRRPKTPRQDPAVFQWTLGGQEGNGKTEVDLPGRADALGTPLRDYFYRYGPLRGDNLCSNGDHMGSQQGEGQNGSKETV